MKGELEDWLSELPPLDGADDEPDANESIVDDALPSLDEDSSLDDAAADDLEVDETVDIAEEESSDGEDDDRWEADVGEPELDLDDAGDGAAGELDSPALGDGDFDLDDDLPTSEDDLGEEGTTDPIEHSLDETLPALDADEEGDFEDALLLEAGLTFPQGDAMGLHHLARALFLVTLVGVGGSRRSTSGYGRAPARRSGRGDHEERQNPCVARWRNDGARHERRSEAAKDAVRRRWTVVRGIFEGGGFVDRRSIGSASQERRFRTFQ